MSTNTNENSELFLNAGQVRARYGGASHMWIKRRMDDAGFPQPTYFSRLRFWKLSELVAWERDQAAGGQRRAPTGYQREAQPKSKVKRRRAA